MSTFNVNTTLDSVAVNLRTGKDASGHVSLRSAIMAANARPGSDLIKLRAGAYTLTIDGANENAHARGGLGIPSNRAIKGSGSAGTIIDGNDLDRVVEIARGNVNISGVTIRRGRANFGGGLLNDGGRVTLSSVAVTGNHAVGTDGVRGADGANARGPRGGDGGNATDGTAGLGGGIFNAGGSLAISKS